MYRPALSRLVFRVVGLLVLPILALPTACGAPPPEEPKPRPLPEDTQTLSPGTYRSEEFEPSFSFTIGEGWTNQPLETSDNLALTWGRTWLLRFFKPQVVYEPNERYGNADHRLRRPGRRVRRASGRDAAEGDRQRGVEGGGRSLRRGGLRS